MSNKKLSNLVKFHKSFLPQVSNDAENLYIELLDKYIKDSKVSNIALTGGYGSGKSSIIETYVSTHHECKQCKVSLAKYNNQTIKDKKLFYENLYEEIIKQIYLNIPAEKVPRSNFSYLHKKFLSIDKIIINIILVPLIIIFIKRFLNLDFNFSSRIVYCLKICYLLFTAVSLMLLIYNVIDKKLAISSVKLTNVSFDFNLHNKNSNPLDKFLSEIIYLFKKSEIKVVFFEDLDRFNDINVFVELKELNKSINLALSNIGRNVSFVYAIKEDLFENSYDRFKFFYSSISVVPYSSLYNTYDLLIESYLPICDAFNIKIKKELFNSISFFIHEYRAVIAIANDFIIYYNRILAIAPSVQLIPENLLYLLVYKNLFAIDFAKNYNHSSIVDIIALNLKSLTENKCETLNDAFEYCNDNIDNRNSILNKIKKNYGKDTEKNYDNNFIDFVTQGIFEGYINDSFGSYISYIYNVSISENDYNFIAYIKDNNNSIILEKDYKLDSPQTIIDRLHPSDFLKGKILNFSLFAYISKNYLGDNNEKISNSMTSLLKSIDSADDFINDCFNEVPEFDKFMSSIFNDKSTAVNYFVSSSNHATNYIKVLNLVLSKGDKKIPNDINSKLVENNNSLKKIIESTNDKELFFGISNESIINIIKDFQIKFEDIEHYCFNDIVLKYIIENNNYYINKHNFIYIYNFIQNDSKDDEEILSFKELRTINTINDYVKSSKECFDKYFDVVWMNRLNFAEDDESFNDILHFVINDSARYKNFIDNVSIKYKDISHLRTYSNIINNLIELNKIELNRENLIFLCGSLSSNSLIEFINLNIDEIKKIDLNHKNYANVNEYIYNSISDNYKKLEYLYSTANSFTDQIVLNKLESFDADLLNKFKTKEEIYITDKSKIFASILEKIKFIVVDNDKRRTIFMKITRIKQI